MKKIIVLSLIASINASMRADTNPQYLSMLATRELILVGTEHSIPLSSLISQEEILNEQFQKLLQELKNLSNS